MTERSQKIKGHRLMGTTGPIRLPETAIADAHNHLWIDPVSGADPQAPVLNNGELIRAGLKAFHRLGGSAVMDCQPAGCGRNGFKLRQFSDECDVHIIACTGFHLRKYYPPEYWLFQAGVEEAIEFFLDELRIGLVETRRGRNPVRAGFIKVACERSIPDSPIELLEAGARAALEAGAAVAIHTERGSGANAILTQFDRFGLPANRIVLCHMDKRPDAGLHRELADRGALLEYDTFFRPKYEPEKNVWPLLEELAVDGYSNRIALATDMAEAEMWREGKFGSHLTGLITVVKPKLESIGFNHDDLRSLLGGNIIARLALYAETELGDLEEH